MPRTLWFGVGLGVLVGALLYWRGREFPDGNSVPFEPPSRLVEPSPLCPWREPDADLRRFFPEANRFETERHILSGLLIGAETARRLGWQGGQTVALPGLEGIRRSVSGVLAPTQSADDAFLSLWALREPTCSGCFGWRRFRFAWPERLLAWPPHFVYLEVYGEKKRRGVRAKLPRCHAGPGPQPLHPLKLISHPWKPAFHP